jgi:hypothetical protein
VVGKMAHRNAIWVLLTNTLSLSLAFLYGDTSAVAKAGEDNMNRKDVHP